MILGRQLIESYEEDERLFSTGDPDLDDILEEVYYSGIEDGYDYAQKEFALSHKPFENRIMKQIDVVEGRGKILKDMGRRLEEIGKEQGSLSNEYMAQAERWEQAQHQFLKSKKKLTNLKKAQKAAPWVAAGTAAAGAAAAGIALSKKKKKSKEENKD